MLSGLKNCFSGFSAEKCAVVAALVISATIILSNIVGFFRLDMPLILLAAAIISLWLSRDYKSEAADGKIFLLALFLFALLIYPVALITPVFPASNDAVSTTAMRVMQEKIELDYAQYGKINMPYPIGLPVTAKAFHSVVPAIPDYLAPYSVALIAGMLQIFFVYLIAAALFRDKKAGIISAALLFAGKYIFENIYVGELGWYLGSALMLGFIYLFLRGSRLKYVVFPAIFLAHPISGLNTLLFLAAFYLAGGKNVFSEGPAPEGAGFRWVGEMAKLFSTLVVVIPGIALTYLPIAANFFGSGVGRSESLGLVKLLTMLPFWVGTGLTLMTVAAVAWLVLARKKMAVGQGHKIIVALLIVSLVAMGAFELMHFMLSHKVIEMIILSLVFFTGAVLSGKELNLMGRKSEAALIIGVLIIGVVFFSASSILTQYRAGSKISAEAMEFSAVFHDFDKAQKKVLFLTKWGGKIAEYSDKIPFDITAAHSIISYDFMYYHNDAFYEMQEKRRIWEDIFLGKKTGLVAGIDVDYIVAEKNEFNIDLNYPVAFEYKDFRVYQKA
ncbi:MAG TPA: hypothetical protein VFF09_00235 [archaeon]|nr:hypothetical protein [archaeon]